MERCPICRATLNGSDTCRRCRAELGSVISVETKARRLLGKAMHRLTLGDRNDAVRLLRRSLLLHRTPEAMALERLLRR
jgi:predicted amidophosphoribosyltransferase